jgi:endonuclease YncB( thermonuclease family)
VSSTAIRFQVFGVEPNVRLVGFDAPETWHPDCDSERALGLKATARLRELVRGGHLTFEYVRCSCPESKIGTHWCNYRRDCGTLKSNGRDVGAILIEEDLAVPFVCGKLYGRSHATLGSPYRQTRRPSAWQSRGDKTTDASRPLLLQSDQP